MPLAPFLTITASLRQCLLTGPGRAAHLKGTGSGLRPHRAGGSRPVHGIVPHRDAPKAQVSVQLKNTHEKYKSAPGPRGRHGRPVKETSERNWFDVLLKGSLFLYFVKVFSATGDVQYHPAVVSGGQHGGQTVTGFTECPRWFQGAWGTVHRHCSTAASVSRPPPLAPHRRCFLHPEQKPRPNE